MPAVTGIFFVYTLAFVLTENASDAWHIQRYPTRKHCITSMYYSISKKSLLKTGTWLNVYFNKFFKKL